MAEIRTVIVPDGLDGERIDAAIARMLGFSRTKAAELVEAGDVLIDDVVPDKSTRVAAGAMVEVTIPAPAPPVRVVPEQIEGMRVLYDDDDAYCPTGQQLKAWLFGGQSIKVEHALFDVDASGLAIVADLFGEDRYFADADAFWTAQNAVIDARKEDYLDAGWFDVVIVPPGEYFYRYEFAKAPKRKGGRVYIDVRESGEVEVHEGYVTSKEAKRLERGEAIETGPKVPRPEVTSTMQTYINLHRHAAVRASLTRHPKVALRLMVAHVIVGSPLWTVKPEPQTARNDDVRESVETCRAETDFDAKRRAVLDLLGFSPEEPTVTGGNGDDFGLVGVFLRLLDVPDRAVMDVIVIVMGETLASGSAAIEAVGGCRASSPRWRANLSPPPMRRNRARS